MPPLLQTTAALVLFCAIVTWTPEARDGRMSPENIQRLQDELAVSRRSGAWSKGLAAASKLLEAHPNNHIYLFAVAEMQRRLGNVKAEADALEQFLQYAPIPVEACPRIGLAYETQGRTDEALDAFERCLAMDPNLADSVFYLARALERKGQYARAATLYRSGYSAHPGYLDLGIGLARVQLRQNRADAAKATIDPILRSEPDNVDALLAAGLIYRETGQAKTARGYLERGVKLSDGYADLHAVLASIAEQQGDTATAVRHYEKLARTDKSPQLITRINHLKQRLK
jgi:protein O-GlcNAc transferase